MRTINLFVGALMLLSMFGCVAASSKVEQNYTYSKGDSFSFEIIDQANVPENGMNIFKTSLANKLNELGLGGSSPNKNIEITFTNYNMRHGAKRALLGAFAGSDSIITAVVIKEKNNGNIVGSLKVESGTSSPYASANKLVEGHADKIANYLKTGQLRD